MGVLSTYLYAIIGIIVVGLFFLVLWLLCHLLEKAMRRRLTSCDTAIQANRIRSNINNARKIVTIVAISIGAGVAIIFARVIKRFGKVGCCRYAVRHNNHLRQFMVQPPACGRSLRLP